MSDVWCAMLENTQNTFERCFPASKVQALLSKNVFFMPISALSLKFYNIRYFSFSFEKKYS